MWRSAVVSCDVEKELAQQCFWSASLIDETTVCSGWTGGEWRAGSRKARVPEYQVLYIIGALGGKAEKTMITMVVEIEAGSNFKGFAGNQRRMQWDGQWIKWLLNLAQRFDGDSFTTKSVAGVTHSAPVSLLCTIDILCINKFTHFVSHGTLTTAKDSSSRSQTNVFMYLPQVNFRKNILQAETLSTAWFVCS